MAEQWRGSAAFVRGAIPRISAHPSPTAAARVGFAARVVVPFGMDIASADGTAILVVLAYYLLFIHSIQGDSHAMDDTCVYRTARRL